MMENESKLDRINREWKMCKKSITLGTIGASAGPLKKNNLLDWEAIISGPNDTPYEGGIFTLTIKFNNTSIVTLLADYNNDDAAERGWDQEPKELYFKDKNIFIAKAKEYTKKYGDI